MIPTLPDYNGRHDQAERPKLKEEKMTRKKNSGNGVVGAVPPPLVEKAEAEKPNATEQQIEAAAKKFSSLHAKTNKAMLAEGKLLVEFQRDSPKDRSSGCWSR